MSAETMLDLVYVDPEKYEALWNVVAERFPAAKITDASDFIHDRRFEVVLPADTREDYLRFALAEGFGGNSFTVQMMARMEPEKLRPLLPADTPDGAA